MVIGYELGTAWHGLETDQVGVIVCLVLYRVHCGACPIVAALTALQEGLKGVDSPQMEGQLTDHGQQGA